MITLRARYGGVCPDCEARWHPGDLIRSRPVGAEHHETWHHAHCPDPLTARLIGKRCVTFWLIHPEGACDR